MIERVRVLRSELTIEEQVVMLAVGLVPMAWAPIFFFASAPRVAVVLALAPLGLVHLFAAARRGDTASALGACYVGVAVLSALVSPAPLASLVGSIDWWTGAIGIAAYFGWWSLGQSLGTTARGLVIPVLTVGALWNALIALMQVLLSIENGVLASFAGRGAGTMTNPVYYAAFMCGVLALWLFRPLSSRSTLVVFALSCGVGFSNGRIALVTAVLAAAVAVAVQRPRRMALTNLGAVVAGLVLAVVVFPRGGSSASATTNTVTARGFGTRVSLWRAGVEALVERPLLGWGPGNVEIATERQFDVSYTRDQVARVGGIDRWLDTHNFVLNAAVTTGLIGVAVLGAFVIVVVRRFWGVRHDLERRAFLAGAVLMAANWTLQPSTIHSLPIAFFLLGVCAPAVPARSAHAPEANRVEGSDMPSDELAQEGDVAIPAPAISDRLSRPQFWAIFAGVAMSCALLVNLALLERSFENGDVGLAHELGRFGYWDPFVDQQLAVEFKLAILDHDTGEMLERARSYAVRLGHRYPVHFAHSVAGELSFTLGDDDQALQEELDGLAFQPWNPVSHRRLLVLAALEGDQARFDSSVEALCRIGVPDCDELRESELTDFAEPRD